MELVSATSDVSVERRTATDSADPAPQTAIVRRASPMSLFGGRATGLLAVALSGTAVVCSLAGAALGWWLAAALASL